MLYTIKSSDQDTQLLKERQATTKGQITSLEHLTVTNQIIVGTLKGHLEIFNYKMGLDLDSQIITAHTSEVTGISSHPSKEKCWVTSSSDCTCVLWDKSQTSPASFLLKNHRNRLTCVKWLSENLIMAGDSCGKINLIDPRNPKVIVSQQKVADRSINTLTFTKNMKTFGVISETPELKIYQINDGELKIIHEHSARPYILYSMVWDPKEENTCYVVGDKKYAKKITLEN